MRYIHRSKRRKAARVFDHAGHGRWCRRPTEYREAQLASHTRTAERTAYRMQALMKYRTRLTDACRERSWVAWKREKRDSRA